MDGKGKPKASQGIIDSLPIRGGERVDITLEDNYGNELKVDEGLYVNRLRDVDAGTSQDIFFIDLASREYFANEQTRVTKRYEGSISQNVEKILKDVLLVESKPDVDETLYDHSYMTRRITACYSRGRNGAVGYENICFFGTVSAFG